MKNEVVELNAFAAIELMFDVLLSLQEEMQEAFDNTPESLQQSSVGEAREQAASDLDDCCSDDECPHQDIIPDIVIKAVIQVKGGKRRGQESRSVRRDNAVSCGQAGAQSIIDWVGDEMTVCDEGDDYDDQNPDDHSAGAIALSKQMRGEYREKLEEIQKWCEEVLEKAEAAENVEFPGAFGR